MINFFRKIRQKSLTGNKFIAYLFYALGEIILVVFGILIALQINDWNEQKKVSEKELALLYNLKSDIQSDIQMWKHQDSVYAIHEVSAASGLKLFFKAKTAKDIDSVTTLTVALWNVLGLNLGTYNEMINSGNMYSLKNKQLQRKILSYYLSGEADKNYIASVNEEQAYHVEYIPDFYPYKLLISQLRNPGTTFSSIDTTWINDPNSKTYLAVANYLNSNQETNNIYRRSVYRRNIESAESLIKVLHEELETRKR